MAVITQLGKMHNVTVGGMAARLLKNVLDVLDSTLAPKVIGTDVHISSNHNPRL